MGMGQQSIMLDKGSNEQKIFGRCVCTLVALFLFLCGFYVYISSISKNNSILDDEVDLYRKIMGLNNLKGRSFNIDLSKNVFLKDGEPFQYISGSVHYNRIPLNYWTDRLMKIKAAGLDAVQFYVPWNYHEFEEGTYQFSENRDVEKFISLAASLDLLVIIRAGPYICGEWDFGGIPAWLLAKNSSMVLRSSDPQFTAAVGKWFDVLLPRLRPHLYENNGPIIMVQLENEYGSFYTCDMKYLNFLYDKARSHLGDNVILFTTDGFSSGYLKCGAMDNRTFATVDFGAQQALNPNKTFRDLRQFRKHGPLVNSEYYVGWLDNWGQPHAHVDTAHIVAGLHSLLSYSISVSVNMYMFHGGTNFGYWNGANSPPYRPQVTSYDYDAPITEAGDITDKYIAIRKSIFQMKGKSPPPLPTNTTKRAYGIVSLNKRASLLPMLKYFKKMKHSVYPLNMESIGQYQGYSAYSTQIAHIKAGNNHLNLTRVGDEAHVFIGPQWRYLGTVSRPHASLNVSQSSTDTTLVIVVENRGHVNFNKDMVNDVKGVIGNVTLNGVMLKNFQIVSIDLENLPNGKFFKESKIDLPKQCSIHRGELSLQNEPEDTFVNLIDFSKGQLHINGHNVGRYCPTVGPQVTLFVPKYFLNTGVNRIEVFELEDWSETSRVQFIDYPIINKKVIPKFNISL